MQPKTLVEVKIARRIIKEYRFHARSFIVGRENILMRKAYLLRISDGLVVFLALV